jgi:ribosome biogenesis GTPase / thiamine phosphate phosphatase
MSSKPEDRRALQGLVVAAHRRHYLVDLDEGGTLECVLKGRTTALACGDRVDVERAHREGVIVGVARRHSLFYRSDAYREKLIAANVTQVIGIVAPDVPVDEHLLNRWIVAAETQGCGFVLVVNKADLPEAVPFAARFAPYEALGCRVVPISARHDVAPLVPFVAHEHSVVIGQSGMGKSTLVNALVPGARARVGHLSLALRSGRHTTTSAMLYRLATSDGWIVDSPGMKVFGLAHCTRDELTHAFVELRDIAERCRFRDCRHDREPGCAVNAAVAAGRVAPQRVALLRALVAESETANRAR